METSGKYELRAWIKKARQHLDPKAKNGMDHLILKELINFLEPQAAEYIYCYVSTKDEVDTRGFLQYLWDTGKRTAVPKVHHSVAGFREMGFYEIRSLEDLEPGCMGILEPKADCPRVQNQDALVIVPGLAFSGDGGRIGYGGGYYDRFFAGEREHLKIALAYDFQLFEEVPVTSLDCDVDFIITPAGSQKCRKKGMERKERL